MPQVMWVENGEIKTAQANLYQCSICGEVNYYPEKPQHCLYCKKKASFKPFTPPEIKELWKPYGMEFLLHPIDDIAGEINKFLDSYLYLEDYRQLEVMTRWIIASYRQDQFQFAPYLQFIGPVESGKTRALELIALLSYRGILHAAITPAALCREITLYHPTVCMDQAEQSFNQSTERGAEMYNIFMCGYRSDQKYIVASQESDTALVVRYVFGFKAIASTNIFDEALASRSIIFHERRKAEDTRNRPGELGAGAAHTHKLLYWRLCNDPLAVPTEHPDLSGRLREIYSPLMQIRPILLWRDDELIDFILKDKIEKEQDMADTAEASILLKIKEFWENPDLDDAPERVWVKDLVGSDVRDPVKERRYIGYKLKSMNIKRKHGREGHYIDLNDEETKKQLRYMFDHFHIERLENDTAKNDRGKKKRTCAG